MTRRIADGIPMDAMKNIIQFNTSRTVEMKWLKLQQLLWFIYNLTVRKVFRMFRLLMEIQDNENDWRCKINLQVDEDAWRQLFFAAKLLTYNRTNGSNVATFQEVDTK